MGRNKKSNPPYSETKDGDKRNTSQNGVKWLWGVVDLLASEYGWTKDYIFNEVYFDEFYFLRKEITKRHRLETLRDVSVYHGDPKELIESLESPNDQSYIETEQLDKSSFKQFKEKITSGSGFVVKS